MATNSPNMNLPVPGVGTEAAPTYAFDINSCLTLIDQHDHSSGQGVQITPAGININAALDHRDFPATNLKYIGLFAQASASTVLQSLSSAPASTINELFYTDSNGVSTQITSNGVVNAIASSIPGQSYNAGTFIWVEGSGSTTPANFDIGSITIRPNTAATTNGVTLTPPSGISTAYTIALPALPASTAMSLISSAGVMSTATYPLLNGSLAAGSVTTTTVLDASITLAKLSSINVVTSSFGPAAIPTSVGNPWYQITGNSVTLTAGTWRLSGTANWLSTANAVADVHIGYFGANGNNTSTTPAALSVAAQLSGRLGDIQAFNIVGSSIVDYFVNAPDTIVQVNSTTVVYLNLYHQSASGAGMNYKGTISAEQLR